MSRAHSYSSRSGYQTRDIFELSDPVFCSLHGLILDHNRSDSALGNCGLFFSKSPGSSRLPDVSLEAVSI